MLVHVRFHLAISPTNSEKSKQVEFTYFAFGGVFYNQELKVRLATEIIGLHGYGGLPVRRDMLECAKML